MKPVLVAVFRNEDEQMEGRVFDLGARGFSAALVDLDSGNTFDSIRIFPEQDAAESCARAWAGV